ncbi:hypothetical protein B9G55_18145 [Saccharibacillus sp. O16]|nr:hypothetical protein B9G55_18145 [Saccharibacillus sp. O16]
MEKLRRLDIGNRLFFGSMLLLESGTLLWWNGFTAWWKVIVLLLMMLIGLCNLGPVIIRWKMKKLRRRQERAGGVIAVWKENSDELEERYRSGRRGSPSRWYWRNAKDLWSINNFAVILLGWMLFYPPSDDPNNWMAQVSGGFSILAGLNGLYASVWKRSRRDIKIEEIRSETRIMELERE